MRLLQSSRFTASTVPWLCTLLPSSLNIFFLERNGTNIQSYLQVVRPDFFILLQYGHFRDFLKVSF